MFKALERTCALWGAAVMASGLSSVGPPPVLASVQSQVRKLKTALAPLLPR